VTDYAFVQAIHWYALPVALRQPFIVASASVERLANLAVAIRDTSGRTGWGELAVFPPITPESADTAVAAADAIARLLLGRPVARVRNLSHALKEEFPAWPGLRAAVESALLDLYTQAEGTSVWALLGGALPVIESDITLPIAAAAEAVAAVRDWQAQGFRIFKVKVGRDLDRDLACIGAIHAAAAPLEWIIDANAGYTPEEALALVRGMRALGIARFVFEQPLAAEALTDLARIATEPGVTVLADESVRSVADVWRVLEVGHIQALNVKLAKSGVFEALRIARLAQRHGLGLMMGGMVETRLGMGMSAQVAAGLGGFGLYDLDTPLLLAEDPVTGGYRQDGPYIEIDTAAPGHGAAIGADWCTRCVAGAEA
jgi:L-alanine-DL-glutamate epimerase-like enolase superfamily enzyme